MKGIAMFRFLLFALLTAVYAALLAWPAKFLWNLVAPQLFHLQQIDYWQGFALVVLSRILFGMRLVGFLVWTAVLAVGLGWVAQWLWNLVGPPLFHLPSITWLQAGALVALLQVLFGGAHHWKRAHGFGIWRSGRWKHGDAWEEHFQGHARMHKDEWRAFRRHMREVGRKMHDHGRRWKEWADESAPCGNHRNWKRFDEFWREKGKAQFEEWLRERGSGAS